MTTLIDAGLSKKLALALVDQGIDSLQKLCSFTLDDLGELEGVGPAALLQIAKLKEQLLSETIVGVDMASGPDETVQLPVKAAPKYMTEEPPKELRTKTTQTFTIEIQFRHAEWITRAAEAYGMTEEQVIQQAIRGAYAKDPYKAGETASSGSILKHDNQFNPDRNA